VLLPFTIHVYIYTLTILIVLLMPEICLNYFHIS
jgi:hypothetical protein